MKNEENKNEEEKELKLSPLDKAMLEELDRPFMDGLEPLNPIDD